MRKTTLLYFLIFLCLTGYTQSNVRIKISSIVPGENTGQDYSSWLSDDLNNLVPNCWNPSNFKYINVTLNLAATSKISRLSLYDYEGMFTDNPAIIYAMKGGEKTLIGTFTGDKYKTFVDIIPENPLIADAIIIYKYCNDIPQKIKIFGSLYTGDLQDSSNSLPRSVITFNDLVNKNATDPAFTLTAKSTNTQTPVTFVSSNPAVISINRTDNIWKASALIAGSATISASQAASSKFSAAKTVDKTIIVHPAGSVTATNVKIPIDAKRWFQLTNASNGLEGLFDGKTDAEVRTGWGKVLDNYDSYYPVTDGEQIDLTKVRMFDREGSSASQPMTLSVITNDGRKITVATFTGSKYNTWVGPDPANPAQFNLKNTYNSIRYLVINSWNFFPAEIELYGNYTPGKLITQANKKHFPLNKMFGVNGFEWNFEAPDNLGKIDSKSFKAVKTFTGFRHYMDWQKLELSQGSYTYNPTNNGGWNYDIIYDSCKAAGIEVLACLKTLPVWMLASYPSAQRDAENVPVKYGKNFTDPRSYIEQAKAAFQYAARYGSNKNVDRALLSVNSVPRWTNDKINTIKVGLSTIKYIECDNERDKWWKGRKAYQTAFEYAANLSAFYDGNKNTMGPGVGIKNADPNMKVVMAGTALASTDYLKGMVDWCRRYRGYKIDGTVNLCWDVINYHFYSNDTYTSQSGNPTRGSAPELSGAVKIAADFIQAAHQYANDMPVWITELGHDVNQGSSYKAIPIGNKTALQTQADWVLRSSLLYARTGVERIFFYEMYDDNLSNPVQFSSSGLINADKTRKPAADYIYQTNKLLGKYIYQKTINTYPIVDCYKLGNDTAYAVVVPDEKGKTAQYTLDLGKASYAKIYTPKIGSDTMSLRIAATVKGKLSITATETPVFVMAVGDGPAKQLLRLKPDAARSFTEVDSRLEKTVFIYPNPSSDFINIKIATNSNNKVEIKILEAGSGRVIRNIEFIKNQGFAIKKIDIHSLPTGYYFVEIKTGVNKVIRKFLKTSY